MPPLSALQVQCLGRYKGPKGSLAPFVMMAVIVNGPCYLLFLE